MAVAFRPICSNRLARNRWTRARGDFNGGVPSGKSVWLGSHGVPWSRDAGHAMKATLAEDLLAAVIGLGPGEMDQRVRALRPLHHMASYKFDGYGGYGPGIKFLETLAIWLSQFNEPEEKRAALEFVQSELIFLSDREIQHAVSLAYSDLVRPLLIHRAASDLGVAPWRVAQILCSRTFRVLQRRTLFLGLADGARLDQFRRSNPDLVHEQFFVTAEPPKRVAQDLQSDLAKWLEKEESDAEATFRHFVLVDDFSGSGYTALRRKDGGAWGGKLHHVRNHLDSLIELGVAASNYTAQLVLYTASEQAKDTLTGALAEAGLDWTVSVVQIIPNSQLVDPGSEFAEICRRYHDPYVDDAVKSGADSDSAALGFRNCRLPLVLSHNTPNNTVGILWENTADEARSERRFTPLFPRHERHKADR